MIQEVQALSLFLLLLSHLLIIKKCNQFSKSIEPRTDNLSSDLKDITEILDDVADLLAQGIGGLMPSPASPNQGSPVSSLLTSFISEMMLPKEHGAKEVTQEWEIRQADEKESPTTHESN
jgi:hypothetical protein